jgi:hypothetical protein
MSDKPTPSDLQKLLDHAFKNPGFSMILDSNPAKALTEAGIEPNDQKVAAVKQLLGPLESAYLALGGEAIPD